MFPALVVTTYENRKKMLKPEQYKYVKNIQHWADIFYKIKTKKSQVDKDNTSYIKYLEAVSTVYNKYEEQKPQRLQRKRQQPAKKISFSPTKQQPPSDDADLKLLGSDDKQPPSDQSEDDIGAFFQNFKKKMTQLDIVVERVFLVAA